MKKCPFCGGKVCICIVYTAEMFNPPIEFWTAHCMDCSCQITTNKKNEYFHSEDEARKAWNTRVA